MELLNHKCVSLGVSITATSEIRKHIWCKILEPLLKIEKKIS